MNPFTKVFAGFVPFWAKLETTGRKSGKPRRVPIGIVREGDAVWVVSEHGRRAQYVRNIERNPRVRVKFGGRWHDGSAQVLEADDAEKRLARQGVWNRMAVRAMGTDLLSIRIDLASPN
ncbi:MAG: hypothetical protein QOI61_649 [Actinomycetota bacterium]|jgi:deazaflavin-dependent oxidoreductase (nitroreductase family)